MDEKKKLILKNVVIVAVGLLIIYLVWLWTKNRNVLAVSTQSPSQSAGTSTAAPSQVTVPPVQDFTIPPINVFNVPDSVFNKPSTSGSGVPNYAPQSQYTDGFATVAPNPKAETSVPSFYYPIQQTLKNVVSALTGGKPIEGDIASGTPTKSDCGCNTVCTSDCTISNSRFTDGRGGCLAFNRSQQIKDSGNNWGQYGKNVAAAMSDPNAQLSLQFSPQSWSAADVFRLDYYGWPDNIYTGPDGYKPFDYSTIQ